MPERIGIDSRVAAEPSASVIGFNRDRNVMRIEQLAAFKRVADDRSYTRAAEREFITQSAIYAQVRQLEADLGGKLVYMSGKEVLLTARGRELYHFAEIVEKAHGQLQGKLRELRRAEDVRVRIGATSFFGVAMTAAERFRAKMPEGMVQFQSMAPQRASEAIRSGDVDFGFFGAAYVRDGLIAEPCEVNRVVVAVPTGHPLGHRKRMTFEELAEYPLVGYAGGSARVAIDDWLRRNTKSKITYAAEADSSIAIRMMALSLMAPALVVEQSIRDEVQAERLIVLDVDGFDASYPIFIIYESIDGLGPGATAFLEEVRTIREAMTDPRSG